MPESRTYPAGRGTRRNRFTSRRAQRKRASTAGCITIAGRAIVFVCCFSAAKSSIRIAARFAWKKMPRWQLGDIESWKCLPAKRKSFRMQAPIGRPKKLFRLRRPRTDLKSFVTLTFRRTAPGTASVYVGIENVLNFLAPSAPDRYFESDGQRYPFALGRRDAGFGIARRGRVAGHQRHAFGARRQGFLDCADRDRLGIGRRLRAHLSRLANHRGVAGGTGARRGMAMPARPQGCQSALGFRPHD